MKPKYVPAGISGETASIFLLEMLIDRTMPINRPVVSSLPIAAVDDTIPVDAQLKNCQLLGIIGIDTDGNIVQGEDLADKIESVSGATDDERIYINVCARGGFGVIAAHNLKVFILESEEIVLSLVEDHDLAKVHFYYLAPTYQINP